VARQAVNEERQRLAHDIEACVRDSLAAIARDAAAIDATADPRLVLVRIQREANRATTELRRQLGLLRAEDAAAPERVSDSEIAPRLRWGFVVASVALLLAGADLLIFGRMEGAQQTPLTVLLTLALPALVIWSRVAPVASAMAAAGLLALGAVIDQPVQDGFALVLVSGVLVWSCAALATVRAWGAVILLSGALLVSRVLNHPENAPVAMALVLLALVGGATVGRSRRRRDRALISAGARRRIIRTAVDEAVGAERRMIARELHDVVSHAVSVIAVQSGAAELSWPADPVGAGRAIEVIRTTAEQTMTELRRLEPGLGSIRHDTDDLSALVNRMRAARLSVTLEVSGTTRTELPGTVYRVVQESLTNALRYAPNSRVLVQIDWRPDCIGVRVADDGPGSVQGTRRGYGLIGLTERVNQAGGNLVIRSAPEVGGFEVAAVLPTQVVGAS
jgi:signal transduction histidine kinase